jgi:hypothetical protein
MSAGEERIAWTLLMLDPTFNRDITLRDINSEPYGGQIMVRLTGGQVVMTGSRDDQPGPVANWLRRQERIKALGMHLLAVACRREYIRHHATILASDIQTARELH